MLIVLVYGVYKTRRQIGRGLHGCRSMVPGWPIPVRSITRIYAVGVLFGVLPGRVL